MVTTSFEVISPEFEGTDLEVAGTGFQMRLTAIPSNTPFRPPRLTPKPFVQGPQTAIVVGKKGEEIYTDEHGRVKVQFHWDRVGKKDENSSCWIRVSSTWAGNAWGAIHLPRIGQEVIVDFLEGDPDRPIITGRVYNADNKPPYALPDNKTQSGVKSRSSKEGTTETFNELRFEDKKDAEEIYFHAEKDFERIVENNDTLRVGFEKKDQGDQTIAIHNNQKLVVGNNESKDGSQTIEIWKNRTETVKEGNEKITIEKGNREVIVSKGNDTLTISHGKPHHQDQRRQEHDRGRPVDRTQGGRQQHQDHAHRNYAQVDDDQDPSRRHVPGQRQHRQGRGQRHPGNQRGSRKDQLGRSSHQETKCLHQIRISKSENRNKSKILN